MPFNDTLDVREGNEKRKRAMERVAQALLRNSQRAGGLMGANRAAGGLGRQQAARFRPLAGRNLGALGRLAMGGRSDMAGAIGRFGIVERQPGANDPGAIPDLGGVSSLPTTGDGMTGGGQAGISAPNPDVTDPGYYEGGAGPDTPLPQPGSGTQIAPAGNPDAGARFENGLLSYESSTPQGGPPAPPGYVNWQGQLIPVAVWKTMQSTGELY